MHEAPNEEAENAHRRRLHRNNQTAQRSAADAEHITSASASVERIRLPSVRQLQSRNQAKYHQQLQLQFQFQLQLGK